jgi:hypothetical protein
MNVNESVKAILKAMGDEDLSEMYAFTYDLMESRKLLPQVKGSGGRRSSGGSKSWAKVVTAVDYKAKPNGYAIDGEFVSIGEKWRKQTLSNGDYMVVKSASGTVAWGQRMAGTECAFDSVEMTDFLMHGKGTMASAVEWFKSQGLPQK